MSNLVKRLRIKAGMIEMGERIEWGSDTALMREAADALEMSAPAVQGEPVGLSRFIEMIEARASIRRSGMIDGITLLRDLRAMLAATPSAQQPAEQQPDVTLLLSLLSHARCNTCDGSEGLYDNHGLPHQCQWCHDRSKAVAAYREGGES